MPRITSVSEASNDLVAIINWIHEHGEEVIVEKQGEPMAAIIAAGDYEELLTLRDQERRRQALQELEALAARTQSRNADLSHEEVEALADEIAQETIARMVEQGKVRFES